MRASFIEERLKDTETDEIERWMYSTPFAERRGFNSAMPRSFFVLVNQNLAPSVRDTHTHLKLMSFQIGARWESIHMKIIVESLSEGLSNEMW